MGGAWTSRCRRGSELASKAVEGAPLKPSNAALEHTAIASDPASDVVLTASPDSGIGARAAAEVPERCAVTQPVASGAPVALSEEDTRLLQLLDAAYGGDASVREDPADWEGYCMVESVNDADNSALYGELLPVAFFQMLHDFGLRGTMSHFCDLGSGTGKLVNLAALLGFQATGIELEPGRHRAACAARNTIFQKENRRRREQGSPALELPRLVEGSFLTYDFSCADIVFAASVVYSDSMMEALAVTARRMKPGAKIVSYKIFPEPGFRWMGQLDLQVSWRAEQGGTAPFQVQEVVKID